MEIHEYLLSEIGQFLKQEFPEETTVQEDGFDVNFEFNTLWIGIDEREIIIGLDDHHEHFNYEFDNLEEAIDSLFLILTKRKIFTDYYKGSRPFKTRVELEVKEGELVHLGTMVSIPLQFWKATTSEQHSVEPFIEEETVVSQWKKMINHAQQRLKHKG